MDTSASDPRGGKEPLSTAHAWNRFRDQLRRFILRQVGHEEDANDILQDVFVKIHSSLHQLRYEEKLESWIYQITRNAITEHHRRRAGAAAREVDVTVEVAEISLWRANEVEEREMVGAQAAELIASCLTPMLETLPDQARQALELTEIDGLTQKEMADHLGLSFSGAKSRVQRARERLKGVLLECCHLEFDRTGNIIDYRVLTADCRYCLPDPERAERD